ncbi:unnamed protein product [Citrullus colocynthis]|uniref:Uncharacterized protein n=1 Tax=Citrullus colocynthis TaxID=252529 RepID=A0ABP0ZAS3_9ROSI
MRPYPTTEDNLDSLFEYETRGCTHEISCSSVEEVGATSFDDVRAFRKEQAKDMINTFTVSTSRNDFGLTNERSYAFTLSQPTFPHSRVLHGMEQGQDFFKMKGKKVGFSAQDINQLYRIPEAEGSYLLDVTHRG